MTIEEAQKLFLKTKDIMLTQHFNIPNDKINPELQFHTRTTALGTCKKQNGIYNIYLSKYILNSEQNIIRDVLAHEIIHTIRGCFNHKTAFKKQAQKANDLFGWQITTRATEEAYEKSGLLEATKTKAKYIVYCPKCNYKWFRQKRTKLVTNPNNFSCSKCKVSLKLKDNLTK